MVFAPRDHAGLLHRFREIGVIAGVEVDRLAVGRENQRMGAMLAAALHLAEKLDLVEFIIAIGVAHAPESGLLRCSFTMT